MLVDTTPFGHGRIGVKISPGSAYIAPIRYNERTEEFVNASQIPASCR